MQKFTNSVLLSTMMFNFINGAVIVVFPIYLLHTSNNYLLATLITGLPLAAQVVGNYFWGWLSDRIRTRKLPAIAGCGTGCLMFLLLPFVQPVTLLLLRTLQTLLLSSQVLLQNIVSDTSERKGKSLGMLNVYSNVGVVAGAIAFVYLLPSENLSHDFMLLFSAVLTFSGGIGTFFIVISQDVIFGTNAKKPGNNIRVFILFLVATVVMWGNYTIFSIFPIYISNFSIALGECVLTGVKITAVFIASSSLLGIPASYIAGICTDRYSKIKIAACGILTYSVIWFILSITNSLILIYVIWVLPVWLFFVLPVTAASSESVSIEEKGWAIGMINAGMGLGALLGSFTAGYLTPVEGFSAVFRTGSLIVFLGVIPLAIYFYHDRVLRSIKG
ncbi:MAG: MFS transporter [Thermoplasmata archaeon]